MTFRIVFICSNASSVANQTHITESVADDKRLICDCGFRAIICR